MATLRDVSAVQTGSADPGAVERAAQAWSDGFLECRTYGHHWQPESARHNKRWGYWDITQKCPSCTSKRKMELTERFKVLSMWIEYADGYLLQGLGRITGESRDLLRAATVLRTFPTEELSGSQAREARPHSSKTREAIGYAEEAPQRHVRSA